MSFIADKFFKAMRLNETEDEYDDDEYLDEADEYIDEPVPKSRVISRKEDDFLDDDDDDDDDADSGRFTEKTVRTPSSFRSKRKDSKISSIHSRRRAEGAGTKVCVIRPHSMEDAKEITDTLLDECTVILNVEGMELELAQRIIDYTAGSCYAIDGNLQKISNYIFIITPASIDITGDFQELLAGAFDVPF